MKYSYGYACPSCDTLIFFFTRKPEKGERIKSSTTFYKDGSNPKPGSKIICPSCDIHLKTLDTKRIIAL